MRSRAYTIWASRTRVWSYMIGTAWTGTWSRTVRTTRMRTTRTRGRTYTEMTASTIAGISPWAIHHEVGAIGIYTVDPEFPAAIMPSQRTIEILLAEEVLILKWRQYLLYSKVALLPQIAVQVKLRADTHEIVEVDLIDSFILRRREVQLVGHLV
jgi:hypothetical protein